MDHKNYSTSNKMIATRGKGKDKLPLNSPEAVKLLKDCNIVAGDVQLMSGVPLVNAWVTSVGGDQVTFCHSVKTTDNKIHIRDWNGNVTTPKSRDKFIDALLLEFLKNPGDLPLSATIHNDIPVPGDILPTKEDVEAAFRTLASPGESTSLDAVLEQIELNASMKGQLLANGWRMITENNIMAWSKN